MGAALHPSPASALDIRQDENVITITADEVIDDTLLAAAELVIVKGNVNGDVVIAGRRLEVDGNVSGNVFAFAESVTVRGQVGGLLLSAGSNIDLNDAQIGGDFLGRWQQNYFTRQHRDCTQRNRNRTKCRDVRHHKARFALIC